MKTGLSLIELATKLEEQSQAKFDAVVDTRGLTMLNGTELHLPEGEGEFEIQQFAHRQIGERLGIPAKFYDRLRTSHTGLLDTNVNTLFREAPERRMIRAYDYSAKGGPKTIRAFLSDRYRRLDNDELANAALPILGQIPDVQFPSLEVTDRRLYINAVAPRVQADVAVGDTVQAGVLISNSEIGAGALVVQPRIFRLVCLNGMVVAKATRQYHIGRQDDSDDTVSVLSNETLELDDRAFFAKMQDVIRAAVDETAFQAVVQQMRDAAASEKMEKPVDSMERLAKRFSFSEGEGQSILHHLIEGSDLTAYGALNAVTRAAQDVESYDRSMELEAVGGKILTMAGTPEWGQIARV